MANREPFELKRVVMLYNIFQISINVFMLNEVITTIHQTLYTIKIHSQFFYM